MLPGPVFQVELLTSARQVRYYALRVLYVSALLVVIWQSYSSHFGWSLSTSVRSTQQLGAFARTCFSNFAWTQGLAVLFLTPTVVAGVIADERQRKTLHYLLASQLSGAEIVVGKLMAKFLHIVVIMAMGLPVMSLLSLFGGIEPVELLLTYVGTATTALFLAAIAVGVSAISLRVRDAILASYLLGSLWLFAPLVISEITRNTWPVVHALMDPVNRVLISSSPLALVNWPGRIGLGTTAAERFLWMVGLQIAGSTALIGLATVRLRPSFRNEGVRLGGLRPRGWSSALRFRLISRPACGDDPMMWKELFSSQGNALTRIVGAVVWLGLIFIIGYGLYEIGGDAFRELRMYGYAHTFDDNGADSLNALVRTVATMGYVLSALGVASAAASAVSGEKEMDTWISLIASDLSGEEILRAKMAGAVWSLRWFIGLILVVLGIGVLLGGLHPFGLIAGLVELVVFLWFSAALGTYYSVVCRNSTRALVWTIGTLVLVNGGYLVVALMIYDDSPIVAFASTPFVFAVSLTTWQDVWDILGLGYTQWGGMFYSERRSMLLAVAACLVGYGGAAAVLTRTVFARFDRLIDRPHRTGAMPVGVALGGGQAASAHDTVVC